MYILSNCPQIIVYSYSGILSAIKKNANTQQHRWWVLKLSCWEKKVNWREVHTTWTTNIKLEKMQTTLEWQKQISHKLQTELKEGMGLEKGTKKFFGIMKIFAILITVMILQAKTYSKTEQIVQFKYLLYFNYISKSH